MRPRADVRLPVVVLVLLSVAWVACQRHGTVPLALEECDPAGYIPCLQQTAFLSIPITDTNLFLTYSSRWSSKQLAWDAAPLGLGGWSINLLQRYDSANRILMSGDGAWRLTDGVKLPSGELAVPSYDGSVAYVFDSAGRHLRTVDGHLGTELLTITYDNGGKLFAIDGSSDGQPVHLSIQRDAAGLARALAGIDGGMTGLALDNSGHLVGITNPAGELTQIAWNSVGLVESERDPAGGVQRFTYGSSGYLASTTDGDGVTQRYERKSSRDSLEISVSTALGRHWAYRAESAKGGIRRTFVGPDVTENVQTTDSLGNCTLKLADGTRWNIGAAANPVWGMASPIFTPIVEARLDGVSSRREVKYNLQPERGLPYVLAGSVTTVINGQPWTQHFDPAQRTVDREDPTGRRIISRYDERGQLLSYSTPGAPPISYTYNAEGRRISETVGAGKLARTTRHSYDANTGQIITTRPDGAIEKTAVDKAGRTVITSSGDGSTVVVGYDSAGRMNQIQPPGGLNFTLGRSPAGRPTAFVPPMVQGDASIETSLYDKDGQLATISGLANRAIAYSYDSAGRVTSSTFDQGKRTFSYDARSGLVIQATDPSGVNTSYGYTGRAQMSVTWSGQFNGSVSIALDANGRTIRETVNGSNLDFSYDPAGNLGGIGPLSLTRDPASGLVSHTALGVVETKQEFDENKQLIRLTTTAARKLILDLRYTRDTLGRIKTSSETTGEGKTVTTEYSYDRADRLVTVRVNGHEVETNHYDPAGNRVSIVRGRESLKANYDDRDRLLSFGNTGNTGYKWMPDGTLAGVAQGEGASAFVYDDFGALRQASLPDGRKIQYLIDADGRRVAREVAGKLVAGYLYRLDGTIIAETDATGKVISRFGYDDFGHVALIERGGVTYRVITDPVGTPRMIIDSRTGAIAEQIRYDAWGNVTEDMAPGFIPMSFAGGLRDPDTGLIRFGARDYDATTGRWTAADAIRFDGGDTNFYAYTGGDPINRVDPSGFCWMDVALGLGVMHFLSPVGGLAQIPGAYYLPCPPPNPPGNPPGGGSGGFQCIGFFCYERNPHGFCFYCSSGDPHLRSGGSFPFDFQAAGEFLVVASSDNRFVVESRQEPMLGGTDVTFNTAVAANVNGDRVGVYAKESSFLLVNGSPLNESDVETRLPHGGTLQRHGATVNITWPDGTRLNIIRMEKMLNYGINPSPNARGTIAGLLGNSGTADDLMGRDGAVLSRSDPAFQTKLYRQFGNSWRIKQSESLFHYWPGESTATFTNLNIPSREVRANLLTPEARSKAEQICRAVGVHNQPSLDDCILDVGITGMPALAAATVGIGANPAGAPGAPPSSATAGNAPAANVAATQLTPSDHYDIKIGDIVSADHPAKGAGMINSATQRQSYSFTASRGDNVYVSVGPCQGAMLNFDLLKPDGSVLDRVSTACRDFGPLTLPATGTYRIVVSASGAARYNFSLRMSALNQFSIKIGDVISPEHPAGAGIITQAGQRQSYLFSGRAGEIVYLGIGPCEGAIPFFEILMPDNRRLDGQIGCHDLGREVLPQGGVYRIVARTDKDSGRYSFFLRAVPADQHFEIRLPLTVSPDAPRRGAGRVAAQGAQQFYDFTAIPGSKVHIEGKCSQPCPNLSVKVTTGGDSSRVGLLGLDHLNLDWKLAVKGTYTIQVRSDGYTGNYGFTASEAKP